MSNKISFKSILEKYRKYSFSERDKGDKFERLIQAYLLTDPKYSYTLKKVWLWNEFPGKKDFGGKDTGIDLVALTNQGDYWAIQCKCFQESSSIDKPAVDSFLATSSREFKSEDLSTTKFSHRIWVSTTNKWGTNAQETIKNQNPPVTRINLYDLEEASVDWSKLENGIVGEIARIGDRELREHQIKALKDTNTHFKTEDRGKLIMACGTGKTFTSLRIAENETEGNGFILFLVPSIALLGQTLREWTTYAKEAISPICICSDPRITRNNDDDNDDSGVVDLAFPASTDVKSIIKQFNNLKESKTKGLKVVFSTYQSIDVIAEVQKQYFVQNTNDTFGVFDLIICDEAHRTTGVKLSGNDESAFVKVHNNEFLKAKKRLYMTATPRLFSDESKSKADQSNAEIWSMNDSAVYGEEIYRIGFGEAVDKGLLTDYKVLILTLSDKDITPAIQSMIADENNEINSDDASKLIGCINALSKQILGDEGLLKSSDPDPMKRAVAFCQNIKISKSITSTFNNATDTYLESVSAEVKNSLVSVTSQHIDGSMSAPERDELLGWLKSTDTESNECRILTNVRCLSEGVDVPTLDAVLFLSARNSQVDVVQSVGRVMRRSQGKNYGYIIIPVVIPSDVDPAKALDDNERYKVVWTVLNALRAHDDRFNATVNKIELNKKKPTQIIVGGISHSADDEGGTNKRTSKEINDQLKLQFEQLQSVVYAKMVQKVGDKVYWERWAKDVAIIAEKQIERIKRLISESEEHKLAFERFLLGLQKNINPSITHSQAIEMLSQHIITRPVFEALFDGYSFVKNNAISTSMQSMLDLLEEQTVEKDSDTLQKFYESVKVRAAGIDNAEGKQRIIIELYDKFFKTAFPKMVEQLGIVYTPVEVVDFIIHSVNDVLQKEFNRSISDENIHILDPFTGTGTFITRLLQSGLIKPEDLDRKYSKEIHANEIVLLAYYIAAVNIENTFHDLKGENTEYKSFDGICLTDTFQLGETDASERLISEMFPQNSQRVANQKKAPLRVIIGNPPYSIGQKSANDNAQNQNYPSLDSKITNTYAKESSATLNKSNYDAYIKAFRWSTERLDKNGGIISFVTNGNFLYKPSMDGFRKMIEKEFSSIYIFDLRGAIKGKSGNNAKIEGQNVFDIMTGVAITLLVKKPNNKSNAVIKYLNIGDYLKRNEKLSIIQNYKSILSNEITFEDIKPNIEGDWLEKRTGNFNNYNKIEPLKKFSNNTDSVFITYAIGVATNRDAWVYNFSVNTIDSNMSKMIEYYNIQRQGFQLLKAKTKVEDFIDNDNAKISWTRSLRKDLEKNNIHKFDKTKTIVSLYRPFCIQNLYYDKPFIESPGISSKFFPNSSVDNLIIIVNGIGSRQDFSSIISNKVTNLDAIEKAQCFPLYHYEVKEKTQGNLFDNNEEEFVKRDAISNFILERAIKIYGKNVTKEDIFYYVYAILQNKDYQFTFANDLKKMLPRIPLVDEPKDFWKFSKAGRELADLHINYESVPAYDGLDIKQPDVIYQMTPNEFYRVDKMRFPKKDQKDTIIYNSRITISNIPLEAYEYVVNGKSAIEWIMERYQITTNKDNGIKNDPNDWSEEVGNPSYVLDLISSIINVSLKTVKIVNDLPKLNFN